MSGSHEAGRTDQASDLQGYLTNVVADMMKKKDRTVVGWEEIIQRGKVNHPVVALMWHNVGDTIQATKTGHKAILAPATHMYLDFPESGTPGEIKAAAGCRLFLWRNVIPWKLMTIHRNLRFWVYRDASGVTSLFMELYCRNCPC